MSGWLAIGGWRWGGRAGARAGTQNAAGKRTCFPAFFHRVRATTERLRNLDAVPPEAPPISDVFVRLPSPMASAAAAAILSASSAPIDLRDIALFFTTDLALSAACVSAAAAAAASLCLVLLAPASSSSSAWILAAAAAACAFASSSGVSVRPASCSAFFSSISLAALSFCCSITDLRRAPCDFRATSEPRPQPAPPCTPPMARLCPSQMSASDHIMMFETRARHSFLWGAFHCRRYSCRKRARTLSASASRLPCSGSRSHPIFSTSSSSAAAAAAVAAPSSPSASAAPILLSTLRFASTAFSCFARTCSLTDLRTASSVRAHAMHSRKAPVRDTCPPICSTASMPCHGSSSRSRSEAHGLAHGSAFSPSAPSSPSPSSSSPPPPPSSMPARAAATAAEARGSPSARSPYMHTKFMFVLLGFAASPSSASASPSSAASPLPSSAAPDAFSRFLLSSASFCCGVSGASGVVK